ncbi:ABC transporter related protein [Xylanimonas cellulosilytica DSM 15894]|uniref:ABC transporter related protein n=1 Tax=Xylanimonas cellulosilytica (strain DSM 15894 / JCM 12276 / CECT 5975 / KCTC 9989 / LMG 20990 / NBRC 107835 / XIL07) TaxID=446471 RepID=D1BYF2_XYLCX|nr:ABC transporter ATP-binding protein [Xylanimonas cellulosilytica]ACZ31824.1 ABC transporter related protein [Xylanimonas cellulosilytica DSM 15894]
MTFTFAARLPERGFDVALEVPAGRTLALLGPNGAGKSTLLATAAGLLRPPEARILLDGRALTVTDTGAWVPPHARGVGLLAQEPRLFPHLTVLDNVAFGPRSAGASRATARVRAMDWLAEVGLTDLAGRRPGSLSGGQAQRVAIARALAAEPRLVLLDEPLAALDVDVAPTLRHLLHRVLTGRTAVVATHDVLDALLLADDVAVLDGGRIVEHGPTRDVLSRPRSAFAARIAGLNLVTGTWERGALRTAGGEYVQGLPGEPSPAVRPVGTGGPSDAVAGPVDGTAAVAVFRPAAVAVHTTPPAAGSPRNTFVRTVRVLEPHGDLVRVRCDDLAADITPAATTDLALTPGTTVHLTIKAAETHLYPTT